MKRKQIILLSVLLGLLASAVHAATIVMPAGMIGSYTFASGNTYQANPAGTIISNSSTAAFAHTADITGAHDLIIIGVTFNGNGVKGDNLVNVTFQDCTIQNCQRTQDDHQGFVGTNFNNLKLIRVKFVKCKWAMILNGLCTNVLIDHPVCDTCGIQLNALFAANTSNVTVESPLFIDSDGGYYGIEFQPAGSGASRVTMSKSINSIRVENPCYIRPHLNTGFNHDTGFISMPMENARGVHIGQPYFNGDPVINGTLTHPTVKAGNVNGLSLMVIELSGDGAVCENGWLTTGNDPGAMNDSAINSAMKNNRVVNFIESMDMQSHGTGSSNTFTNNGPNVALPVHGGWDLIPGATPPVVVTPPTQPTTDPAITALQSQVKQLQDQNTQQQSQIDGLNAFKAAAKSAAQTIINQP